MVSALLLIQAHFERWGDPVCNLGVQALFKGGQLVYNGVSTLEHLFGFLFKILEKQALFVFI